MSQAPPGLLEARAKAAMEGGGKAKVGGQGDHGHPGAWHGSAFRVLLFLMSHF